MATHIGRRLLTASTIEGTAVQNAAGEDLGEIHSLMIDLEKGRIAYAVLSFGGFFGLGDEYVAVPWEALTLGDTKEYFVLNMKKEHLKDAPGFVVHHFYDRSSVAAQRGGRSTAAPSARVTKGDVGSDVSVARSFDMQYA